MKIEKVLYSILVFVCLLVVSSSCRNAEGSGKKLTDSLIKGTENVAIGNANFGISEKEFNLLFPDSTVELAGNKYIVSSYFDDNGGLNKVYMIDKETLNNLKFDESLFNRMDLMKRYFVNTYGLPKKDRGYPIREKMQDGKLFESCLWDVGKKKIVLGIALEKTKPGNIYYVLSHVDKVK